MGYYEFTFLKLLIGFCVLIAHLNITGKTQLSQMTPIDFIGNFILGGIIGGVIYSDTIPLQQYIILLFLGVILISALNFASKHIASLRTITIGDPIPIMKNGQFILENILKRRNKLDVVTITSQLHALGINSFEEVRYAQLEPGGQLSVITKGASMFSVLLIKTGDMRQQGLEIIEKDQAWLEERLANAEVTLKDVFFGEFWGGELNLHLYDGRKITA